MSAVSAVRMSAMTAGNGAATGMPKFAFAQEHR